MIETTVKYYERAKDYQQGLSDMAAAGWTQEDVVEKRHPQGCLTIWAKRSELVVTYERDTDTMPESEQQLKAGICPKCGNPVTPTQFYCPSCHAPLRS